MDDPYHPFMGKKGKAWGELDLEEIAGRVASGEPKTPPEVASAARSLVAACKKAGLGVEEVKAVIEKLFSSAPVSASPSARIPRK